MKHSCWHAWRLGLGALLTLLAWSAFAPPASAGCERPTVVMWPSTEPSHQAEVDLSSRILPVPMLPPSMPDRQPCRGPHCSRAPLTPPTSPVTTTLPIQEWACFSLMPSGADCQGVTYSFQDDSHKPIFHKFRIYHPPR